MTQIVFILLMIALAAVVCILVTGVIVFSRGGETNRRWSNRLMNMRVATQFVAFLLLGALMLLRGLGKG
jgi:hypothetical protein